MKDTFIIVLILTLLVSALQWVEAAIVTCKMIIIDQLTISLGIDFLLKYHKVSLEFNDGEIQFEKFK
jgi:hypothetical protein